MRQLRRSPAPIPPKQSRHPLHLLMEPRAKRESLNREERPDLLRKIHRCQMFV